MKKGECKKKNPQFVVPLSSSTFLSRPSPPLPLSHPFPLPAPAPEFPVTKTPLRASSSTRGRLPTRSAGG